MSCRFAAVVFDLDGLLIDSESVYFSAARTLLARHGREFDLDFMRTMMGAPARDGLPRFQKRFNISLGVEELAEEFKNDFLAELAGGHVPLMPGARELVLALSEREMPLAIATSSRRMYVEQIFHPHGLVEHFRHILTADDVERGKPDPEIYRLAATRLGIQPHDMVVLEDSENGIRAAKAAGATCIAVPHEHTPEGDVALADLVVASLRDDELNRFLA